jgi:acylphosphatase
MGRPPVAPGASVRWLVSGRVQGVGFRGFVRDAAERRSVHGDVRNLPDGRVEIRATGSPQALEQFLAEVRRGPAGARVEAVEASACEPGLRFTDFGIRR